MQRIQILLSQLSNPYYTLTWPWNTYSFSECGKHENTKVANVVKVQSDFWQILLGATNETSWFPYLCGDSKYTGHVETSFYEIIDVDSQPELLQPVKQRVIVSHLGKKQQEYWVKIL